MAVGAAVEVGVGDGVAVAASVPHATKNAKVNGMPKDNSARIPGGAAGDLNLNSCVPDLVKFPVSYSRPIGNTSGAIHWMG